MILITVGAKGSGKTRFQRRKLSEFHKEREKPG